MRAGVDVDFRKRKFIDVQNIFHKMEQRTLVAAYKFYCGKDLADAHSAEADTLATYEVLKAQLDRYEELQNDVAALAEFSTRAESADFAGRILYNEKGEEVFGFGKYKGRSVAEVFRVEPSYYSWMMNGDFPLSPPTACRSICKALLMPIKGGVLFRKRELPFYPLTRGVGIAAPMALHGAKGAFSRVRECPL